MYSVLHIFTKLSTIYKGQNVYNLIMSSTWNQILSEFLINIAAGWFGAIFITPIYSRTKAKIKLTLLIVNLVFVIFSLWVAYLARNI